MNGTYPQEAAEIDDCRYALELKWYDQANLIALYIDEGEVFEAIYGIIEMLNSVDYIAHSCYDGFEKVGYKYIRWATYAYYAGEIFFNAALHSGDIADDIIGIVLFFDPSLPWRGPSST